MYNAFYAQDQWTLKRVTASGALRFDHATSGYGETCVGPESSGAGADDRAAELLHARSRRRQLQRPDAALWRDLDLFGTGRTALKFNSGKFLNAAGITGVYSGANPGRRGVQYLRRNWTDTDGDRDRRLRPDELHPQRRVRRVRQRARRRDHERATHRRHVAIRARPGDARRRRHAGRSGDHAVRPHRDGHSGGGHRPIATSTASRSSTAGAGAARNGRSNLGVQHEILPRLSGEFTYNRRSYSNITVSDTLNIGCDRFNGAQDVRTCQDAMLRLHEPVLRLLHGDGADRSAAAERRRLPDPRPEHREDDAAGRPADRAELHGRVRTTTWHGFDTNFLWQGPQGLRVQFGTGTGRTQRNTCYTMVDAPDVRGRAGRGVPGRLRHQDAVPDHAEGLGLLHRPEGGRAGQHGVPVAAGRRADGDR